MTKDAFDIHTLIGTIVETDYAVPEGIEPEALIPSLIDLLGVPDQIARERSFEVLGEWGERGHFSDEALLALGELMASNLTRGLGEQGTDSVFLRSYSALVLCTPIGVDQMFAAGLVEGRGAFLPSEMVGVWRTRALESLLGEQDARTFVMGKGWADAVSHTGDVLHQFARSPHTDAEGLAQILHAISARLRRPTNDVFIQNEGGRLMRAAYCALLRDELSESQALSWIEGFETTIDGKTWGWESLYSLEFCDAPSVKARANVCSALHTLRLYLELGLRRWHSGEDAKNAYFAFYDRPVPHREEMIQAVVAVLRRLNEGLPPPE